ETHVLAGKKVYVLGGGALMVCLDKDVSMQTIEGIGQLKETLSPDIIRVVFRDHCFENDVIKTNALLTLKQRYAITDIKSL
ncbi:MAG: site-specific DNA-methyltransferase, partial [Acetobacter sp.]|nr:site-specific DNA-methyltransferase [Acetobacter sp.]